jgi:hypothetical protein
MKERADYLINYLSELRNLAVEFPADNYEERINKVCEQIESELSIPKHLSINCKVDIDPEKLVKNIYKEINNGIKLR